LIILAFQESYFALLTLLLWILLDSDNPTVDFPESWESFSGSSIGRPSFIGEPLKHLLESGLLYSVLADQAFALEPLYKAKKPAYIAMGPA
jgi:hypothetical protein